MAEFQKVTKNFYRMCNTYYDAHCFDCPLSNNKNGKYEESLCASGRTVKDTDKDVVRVKRLRDKEVL